jgi:hypothetical protein
MTFKSSIAVLCRPSALKVSVGASFIYSGTLSCRSSQHLSTFSGKSPAVIFRCSVSYVYSHILLNLGLMKYRITVVHLMKFRMLCIHILDEGCVSKNRVAF